MDRTELVETAEILLEEYKKLLFLDPYFKIKIEIMEMQAASECIEDLSPATWILRLNPEKHIDIIDVQISVIDSILKVLSRDLPPSKKLEEFISKITHSFVQALMPQEPQEPIVAPEEDVEG